MVIVIAMAMVMVMAMAMVIVIDRRSFNFPWKIILVPMSLRYNVVEVKEKRTRSGNIEENPNGSGGRKYR